ncbi:MAG: NTP transferase domain-containing protein [Candidatus Stahlbacteria bacterium]|nr:NTP transferase domain-containing protein [Candidatus Stahlbacteria bacterium]
MLNPINSTNPTFIGAIILAGGNSSRISTHKAFIQIGCKSIIEIMVAKLAKVFEKIVIVTNSHTEYEHICSQYQQIELISDIIPGKGPLGGIYSGLLKLKISRTMM